MISWAFIKPSLVLSNYAASRYVSYPMTEANDIINITILVSLMCPETKYFFFFTATSSRVRCRSGIYNITYIQTSIIYVYQTGLSNKTTLGF
jgi:hypothetical protein